jgi:hypothetical protein
MSRKHSRKTRSEHLLRTFLKAWKAHAKRAPPPTDPSATEWISCMLLMLMYFTSVNDPEADDLELQVLADKKDRSGGAVEV